MTREQHLAIDTLCLEHGGFAEASAPFVLNDEPQVTVKCADGETFIVYPDGVVV